MRSNYLPVIHALAVLEDGKAKNTNQAIESLATAAPYELGFPSSAVIFAPYPVYVRGEVYLAARQGPAAVMEFEKILDHPGVVLNEPIGALAHLQLGRAYVVSGDTAKSQSCLPGLPHPLERR